MLILLITGIIAAAITCAYLYHVEQESIISEFSLSQRYGEEALIHAVQLADQSLSFYDNAYNQPLKRALEQFEEHYHQAGDNPFSLDLATIKDELQEWFDLPIDLYIFNASGVIIASTFEPDIGLNFSFAPKFKERLNTIRLGNTVAYDAIVSGTKLGEERKYAYIPTRDHTYLLEIGINLQEFFKKEGIAKYPRLAQWYNQTGGDVQSVFIFDHSAVQAPDIRTAIPGLFVYPYPLPEWADRQQNVRTVFTTQKSLVVPGPGPDQITHYLYIPAIKSSAVSSDFFDKVAEIVYSTDRIEHAIQQVLIKYITYALFLITLLILFAAFISHYVTRPVYQMIEDIEIIANGDYDHQIRHTKGFEFGRLEKSIQKMVTRLKEDIISIREKKEELNAELHQRHSAEESLRAANHKLALLGSITRHDISNQTSIIASACDLLFDEVPDTEQTSQLTTLIRNALNTIREIIFFTRIYEDMGAHQPVWHQVSLLVADAMSHFHTCSCTIIDKTDSLEVLADPLFDRVIFNLIDNAIRHGKTVTTITVDVHIEGPIARVRVADNGTGIADAEKEKIFERGYGKNTGLGLFLSREILSLTGIAITETGREGAGACFELKIPDGKWRCSKKT